jgi:hypothetical protein
VVGDEVAGFVMVVADEVGPIPVPCHRYVKKV